MYRQIINRYLAPRLGWEKCLLGSVREYPKLGEEDAQRVADLSFRQALREVAVVSSKVAAFEPDYKEKALLAAEEAGGSPQAALQPWTRLWSSTVASWRSIISDRWR